MFSLQRNPECNRTDHTGVYFGVCPNTLSQRGNTCFGTIDLGVKATLTLTQDWLFDGYNPNKYPNFVASSIASKRIAWLPSVYMSNTQDIINFPFSFLQ